MHPRNIFRVKPNYTKLAIKYKDFRTVCRLKLNGEIVLDYTNELVLRALTQVLLMEYFELNIDFAPTALVPALTLRLNYILWIEDLLAINHLYKNITGIDIGCGSSCIYSLLGAKINSWGMFALEVNEINQKYAQRNIEQNQLQHLVTLFKQSNSNIIFEDFFQISQNTSDTDIIYDFCLCNPPFYDSLLMNINSNTRNLAKRSPPKNCHTGCLDELTYSGGEVQFVKNIIDESEKFSHKIRIFTTMLGHKSSVTKIINILKEKNIFNFGISIFQQGNTRRWGIAWSFINEIKTKTNTMNEIQQN